MIALQIQGFHTATTRPLTLETDLLKLNLNLRESVISLLLWLRVLFVHFPIYLLKQRSSIGVFPQSRAHCQTVHFPAYQQTVVKNKGEKVDTSLWN